MKKYLSLFIIFAFMFSVSLAKAEETPANTQSAFNNTLKAKREVFRGELQAKREAFKASVDANRQAFNQSLKAERKVFVGELKTLRDEFKATKLEKKEQFRGNAQKMVGKRFEVAVRNLERIQARVSILIEKLNTAGKDTTDATEYLNLSTQKLDEAKLKVAEIEALIPASGEKVTPEIFEQIKLGARDAKDLFKESHNNLVQAIKLIKGQNAENEDNTDSDDADDNTDDENEDEDEDEDEDADLQE